MLKYYTKVFTYFIFLYFYNIFCDHIEHKLLSLYQYYNLLAWLVSRHPRHPSPKYVTENMRIYFVSMYLYSMYVGVLFDTFLRLIQLTSIIYPIGKNNVAILAFNFKFFTYQHFNLYLRTHNYNAHNQNINVIPSITKMLTHFARYVIPKT